MHAVRSIAALALGAGFALGQPPFDLPWVALPALAGILALAETCAAPRRAGWEGWLFGAGYFGLSLSWLLEPFQVDAAATGWMAPFALVGMAGGLALFWALAFNIGARLGGAMGVALAWALAELGRAWLFTGFPWGLVGYVWANTPAAQWLALIGPHGATLVTLVLVAGLAGALVARRPRRALVPLSAMVLFLAGGFVLMPPEQDLTARPVVRIVQPNAPQRQKWDPAFIPVFFSRQVGYTARLPQPDLVVWPETSVPVLLRDADAAFVQIAQAAGGAPVVLGIQRAEAGRYFNSLVLLDDAGRADQLYDKHHLVPFGEYMPAASLFARFDIAGLAARAEAGYAPGPGPALVDLGPLGLALPLICYEAVFPQDVNAAPERPDLLIQVTNDAWFGTDAGPQQHFEQARLRAIEQGLPLVRSANTGISAMIDGAGRVVARLPLGEAGYLDAPLPPPLPPTLYSRTGDFPVLLLLIVALSTRTLRIARRRH